MPKTEPGRRSIVEGGSLDTEGKGVRGHIMKFRVERKLSDAKF